MAQSNLRPHCPGTDWLSLQLHTHLRTLYFWANQVILPHRYPSRTRPPAPATPASCWSLPIEGICAQHTRAIPLLRRQPPRADPQPTVLVGQRMAGERRTFRAHQFFGGIFEIWFYSCYFPGPPGGHILQVHDKDRLKGSDQLSIKKAGKSPLLRPEDSFDHETGRCGIAPPLF